MNIRDHLRKSIRYGLQARIVVENGKPGVLWLDENQFVPFDDLGYNAEIGYFSISKSPHAKNDCTNENPEAIHLHKTATPDDTQLYVWMDGDGYLHMLGELHHVADLYQALYDFLINNKLHPEPVDEFDPAWGQSYTIAEAVNEALADDYTSNATQMADTIRAAAQAGRIRGARRDPNGRWIIPKKTFRHWLLNSQPKPRIRD